MPKVNLVTNTRANFGYIPPKYKGAKFEKSFFRNTQNLWSNLPKNIQAKIYPISKWKLNKNLNHLDSNTFPREQNLVIVF